MKRNFTFSGASWSNWTLNVLKSGVSGIVQKVVGGANVDVAPNDVFVDLKRLEETGLAFLEKMKTNKMCFRLNKVLFLDRIYLDELSKSGKKEGPDKTLLVVDDEKDLLIKFLKAEGLCDEVRLSDGKVFLKIIDKRLAQKTTFTQQVRFLCRYR